jgi:hypothetical protein
MEQLQHVTVVFTLALALSLVIERLLELVKTLYDWVDSHFDLYRYWDKRTEATRDFMEHRLRIFEYVTPEAASPFLTRCSDFLLGPKNGYTGTVPMLAGDLVRAAWVRTGCKVLGMIIGIFMAFKFDIDLVALAGTGATASSSAAWHFIASGVTLGLGAGPVHKVIGAIEKKRNERAAVGGANA